MVDTKGAFRIQPNIYDKCSIGFQIRKLGSKDPNLGRQFRVVRFSRKFAQRVSRGCRFLSRH